MHSEITLGENKYPVRFTWLVLAQVEKETGKNMLKGSNDIGVNDSIVMAYLGLKKADPAFKMTLEEVGDLFTGKTFNEVFIAFSSDMVKLSEAEKK